MTTGCPRAPLDEKNRGKKNNKPIPATKTRRIKKEKQHRLCMNIRNVYISV